MLQPARGEVWTVNLDPAKGHEQKGTRPGLVISSDSFNFSPASLVVIIPLTTKRRNIPLHVEVNPPEGGLKQTSFIKCEDVRSVSKQRLSSRWGSVSPRTISEVEGRLRLLLEL